MRSQENQEGQEAATVLYTIEIDAELFPFRFNTQQLKAAELKAKRLAALRSHLSRGSDTETEITK